MRDEALRAAGPPERFDNTMGATFEECPRKFYWWRRGFTHASRPSYFAFGSAWGVLQGEWYSLGGGSICPADPKYMEIVKKVWEKGKAYFLEQVQGDAAPPNDLATLETLFIRYVETYPLDNFKVVGAERGWLWPLEGTPYFLGGSIDQYIEWPPYGTLVKEDKTVGTHLTDSYIRQWEFSNQVTGYIWYISKLLGEECFGCLMNLASKKILRGTGKTPQFARTLIKKSPEQLKEFEVDWIHRIHRIEDSWARWHWPKTTNPISCTGGIGKSPCLYQPLCLSSQPFYKLNPLQFPGIIEDDTPWEPWKWEEPTKVEDKVPF